MLHLWTNIECKHTICSFQTGFVPGSSASVIVPDFPSGFPNQDPAPEL